MRPLLLLVCLLLSAPSVMASSAMVDGLGQLPMFKDVTISPDGQRIAYFQKLDGKYVLVNKALNGSDKANVYGLAEGELRNYRWVSNDRLLVGMTIPYYSKGDYELYTLGRTGLLDVVNNEMISPIRSKKFVYFIQGPWLVRVLPDTPGHILMAAIPHRYCYSTVSAIPSYPRGSPSNWRAS